MRHHEAVWMVSLAIEQFSRGAEVAAQTANVNCRIGPACAPSCLCTGKLQKRAQKK